ncbi:MAG: hypothetical protein MUF15_21225 [Acidobacteria bacterium]|nr:hypothetical protein [Acidobacteriota bacterium]
MGETYFIVKIHSAQAAFSGHFWEKIKRLIITSQVKLNHPLLEDEPLRAIQRSREVRPNRTEKLGLSPNLINLVPATMDRISLSLEFVLDKENRLATLGGLINDDAFLAAVSFVPGAAMAARTIGRVSQKLIQSFLNPDEREPILQFSGDFNIAGGELKEGYYVILGTRDEQTPLPQPLPQLELKGEELLADGQPVVQWSYIVFYVRCIDKRTRSLNEGATWDAKLKAAEAIAQRVENDPFVDEDKRMEEWKACMEYLKQAQVLLMDSPTYLYIEANEIIASAFNYCKTRIFQDRTTKGPAVFRGTTTIQKVPEQDMTTLGIPQQAELEGIEREYAEKSAQALKIIRQEHIC